MSCPDAPARRRRGPGVAALPACLAVLAGLACGQARAVLGEPAGGIQAEGLRLSAAVREQAVPGARVHLLQFADGSTVRQFSGADGRVFAVAWATRTKPRLDWLLGAWFADYGQAARRLQQRQPGARHQASLSEGDLVVESTGHAQAFVGRAYLRSRLPAARPADAWR